MLSNEIKKCIFTEVKGIYNESQPEITDTDIEKRIDIFAMALSLSKDTEDEMLKQAENNVFQIFNDINNAKNIDIKNISQLELLLRLVQYLVNEQKYIKKEMNDAMLGKLFKELDVLQVKENQSKKNYYNIMMEKVEMPNQKPRPYEYNEELHSENRLKNDKKVLPFIKAYNGRNTIVHSKPTPNKWERFFCAFYTVIETCYNYREIIIKKYVQKEISYKNYIDNIIKKYKEKNGENFKYIPLAIECYRNDMYYELDANYPEGTTFEKINSDIENKKMLRGNKRFNKAKIIGFAGMGKTTTLENIIYNEALEIKKHSYQGVLPVMLEMIEVSSEVDENSIESLIAKKLETDTLTVSYLISKEQIKFYIDGINEIRISNSKEKKKYLDKIEKFVISKPKLKIIMTDRDNNENSILNSCPTFVLTGVTKENIINFIEGNTIPEKVDSVSKAVKEAIEENTELMDTLRNPFMLKNIISIVECNKKIPEDPDEIAEVFIKSIVERERILKRDYYAKHIIRLLIYLVAEDSKKKDGIIDENICISYFQIINIFNEFSDKYNPNDRFDNDKMLELIIRLGILKQIDVENYTFLDNRYYNFFYFSAINTGLL